MRHLIRLPHRHPSALLLLVQLLGMLLYPFIESTREGHIAFNLFGIGVLAMTVVMVRRTPGHAWISASIGSVVTVLLAVQIVSPRPELLAWSSGLEALFYFYAAGSLIAYMSEDRRATTDELFAAGAAFTLLVWGYTHLFMLTQLLQPGTFSAAVNPAAMRTWTELNYLAFALLSSTGIGDVIPVTAHGRALSSLAMLTGLIYLAAVVARLIGFTIQEQREDKS